ncbi:MAG TPA: hypothetical protein VFQ45_11970 [Longimicrobium sp.]|nr:hypothetical protein [Longimicrobium sp.]
MKKLRVYVDTSVIGGCLDREFEVFSNRLIARAVAGEIVLVISNHTIIELADAPEAVRSVLDELPPASMEEVVLSPEAVALSEAYIDAGVIGARMRADARHIAVATVFACDVLVSWNFKHIVNLQRMHGYNSVNLREGYSLLEIRTPRELTNDGY